MKVRGLTALAAGSLALLSVCASAWVRSEFASDAVYVWRFEAGGTTVKNLMVYSDRGRLAVIYRVSENVARLPADHRWHHISNHPFGAYAEVDWFRYRHTPGVAGGAPARFEVVLRFWYLAGLFAVLPGRWVYRRVFRPWPVGVCRKCGYWLRGNVSGTCPECGTPVPEGQR